MRTIPELNDKVAVVTGAGSGIGRALALQLAASGSRLALADIDAESLKATVKLLPESTSCITFQLDVADRAAYQAFVQQVIADFQQVDIVINNAGIVRLHSIGQGTYEDYEKTFAINAWGVLHGCKEFLPYLKQRPKAWLANISSIAGLAGVANYSSYNMSKFAIRGLTEALRSELRETNVNVSCVHPGGVRTNIHKLGVFSEDSAETAKSLEKMMDAMTAEKAADLTLVGMAKGKRRILVGKDVKALDLITRLLPGSYEGPLSWLERCLG
jgi:NADP-dependent 3-hydroxy acid dehydrogenase YdfG